MIKTLFSFLFFVCLFVVALFIAACRLLSFRVQSAANVENEHSEQETSNTKYNVSILFFLFVCLFVYLSFFFLDQIVPELREEEKNRGEITQTEPMKKKKKRVKAK